MKFLFVYIFQLSDIIDLNNLPSLKDLRINKNPLTKNDKFLAYREKIIARIGNLKVSFLSFLMLFELKGYL